jgi:hypothetical protein
MFDQHRAYSQKEWTFVFWRITPHDLRQYVYAMRFALCFFKNTRRVFNENVFSLLWCFTPYTLPARRSLGVGRRFTIHGYWIAIER